MELPYYGNGKVVPVLN